MKCGRIQIVVQYPNGKQYTKKILQHEDLKQHIAPKYRNSYTIISDEICDGELQYIDESEYDYDGVSIAIELKCDKCHTIHDYLYNTDEIVDKLNEYCK